MLMVIRDAQLEALAEAMSEGFRRYLARHLRSSFPDWAGSQNAEDLDQFIRRAIVRARGHGVGDASVGTFVVLSVTLGEDFDTERPWAARALADTAMTPETRLKLVVTMARDLAAKKS